VLAHTTVWCQQLHEYMLGGATEHDLNRNVCAVCLLLQRRSFFDSADWFLRPADSAGESSIDLLHVKTCASEPVPLQPSRMSY
jgi:hypothetical protein